MKTDKKHSSDSSSEKKFPGYPLYPDNEDIYSRNKEEENIDPEDVSKTKPLNEKGNSFNEKTFKEIKTGDDLDVPGAELDDAEENIGSEDEENNYYSLGDNE